jgi:hypothetical protein
LFVVPPMARARRGEQPMKTRFSRSRHRKFRPAQHRSFRPFARFAHRNEREDDYPEIEVIGPGNEHEGQVS